VREYYNNFEIDDVEFFLRPDVQSYTDAVCESMGIWKYRWGDAPLRFLTLALFSKPEEIIERPRDGKMVYCHGGCSRRPKG
jgi:mannosyltransferase